MSETAKIYFKSLLLKNKKLIALYTFVLFIIYPLAVIVGGSNFDGMGIYWYQNIMTIAVMVLPVMSFRFNVNKKSVDTYYSLPISKKELYIVHYLAPLAALIVPMFVMFLLATALGLALYPAEIIKQGLVNRILSFIVLILINTAQYSLNTWAVNKANSFLDSALIVLGYTAAPYLVYVAVQIFVSDQMVWTGLEMAFNLRIILQIFSPIWVGFSSVNQYNLGGKGIVGHEDIFWAVFQIILGAVLAYLAYRQFCKRKGEDAEQMTTDFWTYPFLIHLASICIVSFFDLLNSDVIIMIIYISLSFVIFMIMNFIAKRSFAFDWHLVARYAVIVALFTGFRLVSKETYFFGINKQHVNMDNVDVVFITINRLDETTSPSGDHSYKEAMDTKKIEMDSASIKEEKFVEAIQELQDIAAEEFKEGVYNTYDWNGAVSRRREYYIQVEYRDILPNGHEATIASRHYSFQESKVKNIIGEFDFEEIDAYGETIEV